MIISQYRLGHKDRRSVPAQMQSQHLPTIYSRLWPFGTIRLSGILERARLLGPKVIYPIRWFI